MIQTSIMPPATAFVQAHGNLLTQLGAKTVTATDARTITATFTNNAAAMNAAALLKDAFLGAQLVIASHAMTADKPQITAESLATALRGIANLTANVVTAADGGPTFVSVSSPDAELTSVMRAILNDRPAKNIHLGVLDRPVDTTTTR